MANVSVENEKGKITLNQVTVHISLGAEIRKFFQELQEAIIQLQSMLDYAKENGFKETEKNLNIVIAAFNELKRDYGSAEILNEIKKTAYFDDSIKISARIQKVKSALQKAKLDMGSEKEKIISLLEMSPLTGVLENTNSFFSPNNKFESLVDRLANFEGIQKKQNAVNSARFFSSKTKISEQNAVVEPVQKSKLK